MYIPVSLDQGEHDFDDTMNSPRGAAPVYRTIIVTAGTPLATIARMAYGHNSAGNRQKILAANKVLEGTINVPI